MASILLDFINATLHNNILNVDNINNTNDIFNSSTLRLNNTFLNFNTTPNSSIFHNSSNNKGNSSLGGARGDGESGSDDEYDNLPDKEKIEMAWYIIVGIIGSCVSTLGVLVNSLSLGVLVSKEMRSTAGLYLIVLTLSDLTFLVCSCVFVSYEFFYYGYTGKTDWYDQIVLPSTPVIDPILSISITVSVYTTIALSIDRSIGVTKPLKWPQICTRFRVKLVLALILIFSVVINIPFMMEHYIGYEIDPDTNKSMLTAIATDYQDSYFHSFIVMNILNPTVDAIIPVIAISVTTVIIIVTLRRRQHKQRSLNASLREGRAGGVDKVSSDTNRITAQVLYISFFTMVSRSLRTAVFLILEYYDTVYINHCPLYCGVISAVGYFFNILNATVNFFCYCYFGNKFRRCFLRKYGCVRLHAYLRHQSQRFSNPTRSTIVATLSRRSSSSYNLEHLPQTVVSQSSAGTVNNGFVDESSINGALP